MIDRGRFVPAHRTLRAHGFPLFLALSALFPAGAAAQAAAASFEPSPHAIDIPRWFEETFLDFREDVREAAAKGKRLMVYFGQDGCPYCKRLMQVNFTQKDVVDKTRRHFVAIAINMWGDREVTWTDGRVQTEKTLAAMLEVQFTPTLLFFNENGVVVLRINGYYPPHKFRAALDYVATRQEGKIPFADYLRRQAPKPAAGVMHDEPFLLKPPLDLEAARKRFGKPLAVLFEQADCAGCDELHRGGFRDEAVRAFIDQFAFARVDIFGKERLVTPQGKTLAAAEWSQELGVAYTPSIVFFERSGTEVFRIDTYVRPFHLASCLDYVASEAYLTQPSFQRFIQARADRIRKAGGTIELW